ncbi:hypothetical protein Acr_00g0005270 [Actinidia rufa]|uniref:RNase H type-1 domain-containing protein n=1 Tax=Actinidia rufa TaxID=165716 RepID=A0A7J0D8B6_9ERIC|nr:hypothetical protein Acr_00g0005270 [Actinidia rufa]
MKLSSRGLWIAIELGVESLDAFSDSQLVVNQVQGDYLAKDLRMVAYLDEVRNMIMKIKNFKLLEIPREENKKVDALENVALTFDFISNRNIPLEFLPKPSIRVTKIVCPAKVELTWMDDVIAYLQNETLPPDKLQAHRIQYRSAIFCLLNGILYKRSFLGPLLWCLQPEEEEYELREIHEGTLVGTLVNIWYCKLIHKKSICTTILFITDEHTINDFRTYLLLLRTKYTFTRYFHVRK